MVRTGGIAGLVALLWAGGAQATASLECSAAEAPDVVLSVLLSRLPDDIVMPLRAEFAAGDRTFATEAPEEGGDGVTIIVPVHAYGDAHGTLLEYMDEEATGILVSLRLVHASVAGAYAEAGVLAIRDVGAWAVTCLDG